MLEFSNVVTPGTSKDKPGEGSTSEENTKALQDIVKAINMIAGSANEEGK